MRALPPIRRDLRRVRPAPHGRREWAFDGLRAIDEADGSLARLVGDGLTVVPHGAGTAVTTAFARETGLAATGSAVTGSLAEIGRTPVGAVRVLGELADVVDGFGLSGVGASVADLRVRASGPVELICGARMLTGAVRVLGELADVVDGFGLSGVGASVADLRAWASGPVELSRGAVVQVPALRAVFAPRRSGSHARYALWRPLGETVRPTGGAAPTAARLAEGPDAALRSGSPGAGPRSAPGPGR
ncbi:hypothetical protein ACL07V_28545 [Streptomyces sp. MB22_4]|uniref:hypothetical protein n=1 Tax=Streptomyces sp. MB22_4 TaxID=3383120 RepID=UPI00399FB893